MRRALPGTSQRELTIGDAYFERAEDAEIHRSRPRRA
jgi:hypothetical protein